LLLLLAIASVIFAPAIMRTLDHRSAATLPHSSPTSSLSLADTIKSEVAKKITDELQGALSAQKKAVEKKAVLEGSAALSAAPEKSIAVLPLVNESGDKDEQYFSD